MLSFVIHGLKKLAQFVQIFHILKECVMQLLLWMDFLFPGGWLAYQLLFDSYYS